MAKINHVVGIFTSIEWGNLEVHQTPLRSTHNRLGFSSRKATADVQQIHLQSLRVAVTERLGRVLNRLREDLILQASHADVKRDTSDVEAKLVRLSQQKLAVLSWHAPELLTEPDFVRRLRIETQT